VFGSVCRLVEQKGLIYALRGFAQVAQEYDAHYAIVGDGPLRQTLVDTCTTLGIATRVHFLGWRTDAQTLYPAFDAFLMPSLWEGFGLVALEAMAAGLPILASRISALPEIVVDGETGYLATPTSVDALAARMRDLLQYPERAAAMGKAGKQRLVTTFSVQKMVESTRQVYGM
jgi:glycosyltransferase involved in cell wall biosynthesis